jgi:predicted N-acetyltransferase YhbS
MPDMLVSLLNLPDYQSDVQKLKAEGINIRRVQPYEISFLKDFVKDNFSVGWADEVMNSFTHQPVTCFIATHEKKIVGFAAYECTRRNYFGPTGVKPDYRGKNIGKALFLASLYALYEMGYAYAIIGGAGPTDFYTKAAGATIIPNSVPGVYVDMLERQ